MSHLNHADPAKQIYWPTVGDDLKAIIEGISDSSVSKPYIVYIQAGVYSIGDNSIAIPSYVNVIGHGSVILDYTGNTTKTAFTMSAGSRLNGVAIQNHLSSEYAIEVTGAGSHIIDDTVFIDCSRCILINNANANANIRSVAFIPVSEVMINSIKVEGGEATIVSVIVGGLLAITNLIWADSSDAFVHITRIVCVVNLNVVNGVYASNSAEINVSEYNIHGATRGIYVLSQASMIIGNGSLLDCDYGIYADGVGTKIQGVGVQITDSVISTLFAGDGVIMTGTGIGTSETMQIHPDAEMLLAFLDTFPGDEAQSLLAELHVGSSIRGRESCLGEGDSYVNGMLVYTYNVTGGVYTDVTTAAKSVTGSTFTFPNLLVDTAIYIGSNVLTRSGDYHQFFGIKFLSTIAQVGGIIIEEYWNGVAWVEVKTMTSESSDNYYRKSDQLFLVTAGSYQVRDNPFTDDWTKNNAPSYAGGNRYWKRYRITSGLTTAPVFQQFKLHANRFEINADGYPETMGLGRSYVGIAVPWNTFKQAGGIMGNQDLWRSTNCRSGFADNDFNSDGDTVGTVMTIPPWVDTSAPLKVTAVLVPAATGTLEMIAWLNSSEDGDTISTSDPTSTTGEVSDTVSKEVTSGEQVTYEFELDISDKGAEGAGISPDLLWVNLEANSRPGDVYGITFEISMLKWRQGDHV